MDLRFLAVAAKDLKILVRDRMALAMLLGMPVMLIVILSFALGTTFEGKNLKFDLPVIDQDGSPASQRLTQLLGETNGVAVAIKPPDTEKKLGEQVRRGVYLAALVIPQGFAAKIDSGGTGNLTLLLDSGKSESAGVVRSVVLGAADRLARERRMPPGDESVAAFNLTTQFGGTTSDRSPGVYEQNVPGFSVLAAFFVVMFLAGSIIAERFQGTFRRLMSTPIRRSHILLGKLLAAFVIGFVQMALLFAFGRLVFGLSLGDQPLGLVMVTVGVVSAAAGLGVLVAAFARTDQQVSAFGTLLVLTMAALGGSMVPRFVMPETMQRIGLITPNAWAIEGYQEVIVRGGSLIDVLPYMAVLLAFAAAFFAVGVARFRYE